MERQHLRELLEQLHAELGRTETVDSQSRDLLRHLMTDVQELLHRTELEAPRQDHPARQRLSEAIEHFEASHPTLTEIMGRVAHALSQIGV
ncbi:MAG: DUF4404 family protein [Acidobacteria bacterium]|nr:DUF4404 family protein [Acidobacteriota bacterium]